MDFLGVVFLTILLMILFVSNFFFIKELNRNKTTHFKYKLFYFIMCIASLFIIFKTYYLFQVYILINLLGTEINNGINNRITISTLIIILNSIANFLILKFYLKRISLKESTKKQEIELIGKE